MAKKWESDERKRLYAAALNKWGARPQINMLEEELAELLLSSKKLFCRDYTFKRLQDFVSEVADVTIMIEQIKVLFDEGYVDLPEDHNSTDSFSDMVKKERNRKLDRLAQRVGDSHFTLQKTPPKDL